jgi:hypothetical protein
MTALWSFGHCGPILEANGLQPIPISLPHPSDPDLGKKPPGTLEAWSRATLVATRLPRYAGCGTGILTATTPAVDIDARHAELADAIDRMVFKHIGDAPVRYGQAPKRLRVYRTAEPFTKLSTAGYRLPGDEPGAKTHKVEILGDGQQFVAYGMHPATGRPYAWPDDNLLDLERDDLPELTPAMAVRIRDAADAMLAKAGTVSARGASSTRPAALHRLGPAPRPVRDLAEARRVLDLLRSIDPSELDRDTWIRSAYGVKAALGECGKSAWLAWSAHSTKHGASGRTDTPARMWARVNPQRCGWRYLERLHGELTAGRIIRGSQDHG